MFKFGFWSQYWHSVTYLTILFLNLQITRSDRPHKIKGWVSVWWLQRLLSSSVVCIYAWVNIGPSHFIHPMDMCRIGMNMILWWMHSSTYYPIYSCSNQTGSTCRLPSRSLRQTYMYLNKSRNVKTWLMKTRWGHAKSFFFFFFFFSQEKLQIFWYTHENL